MKFGLAFYEMKTVEMYTDLKLPPCVFVAIIHITENSSETTKSNFSFKQTSASLFKYLYFIFLLDTFLFILQ